MGKQEQSKVHINEGIRALQLRVIDDAEGNLGVLTLQEALVKARERGLDLIEISPDAVPPVAKITDYGKFQYGQKKKNRDVRAKARVANVEVKEIQIKPGTGDNDLKMKAARANEWLAEGHRVKVDIFLRGREKYMDHTFHKERLQRFLTYMTPAHTIVEDSIKTPNGFALIIERNRVKSTT
jgi:translation initiation factor IF-3